MKTIIGIASVVAALVLASGSASAQQIYGGMLETTIDTSTHACGAPIGERDGIQYRPKTADLPGGMYINAGAASVYIQSSDPAGDFYTDGTKGAISGTALFQSDGQSPGIYQQTVKGSYTLTLDMTDPVMIKITKMTALFILKPSLVSCYFVWNGVMTPALMPTPP